MTSKVFISHSSQDAVLARQVCDALELRGIGCWIAPRDIQPGADWAAQIVEGIQGAVLMLLLFSAHANASPHLGREVERATHGRLPVLPVRIEPVLPSGSMAYFLGAAHWHDAHEGPVEARLEAVVRAVEGLLARRSAGVSTTAQVPAQPLPPPMTRAVAVPAAPGWPPDLLAALQALLAEEVGPVAGPLLRRAAATAADYRALIERLATEVDEPAARTAFTAACRRLRPL
jgi:hypothetical protein